MSGSGRGTGGGGQNKKKGKGKGNHGQKHNHPGGSASVLGARIARYGAFQGVSLGLTNALHFASILFVAKQLGAADLGTYSLLLFWSGLITQVFHIFSKPGTLRRVFGQADDDDAGAEGDFGEGEDEEVSASPQKSLGNGIIWAALMGIVGAGLTIIFRAQIADILRLGSGGSVLVFWAGILGGVGALFKLCDIVIWFERRPVTFIIVDASRPALNLALMAYLINSKHLGVQGAIEGAAIGTSIATVLGVLALVRSFELSFKLSELKLIVRRGVGRMPISTSMWVIQNADSFILAQFVDHSQIGYYKFAQNLGFVVSFMPQGFRIAMRPLRKAALFQAVRDQYGTAVAKGQLLAYFCLVCMTAILAMVLGGTLILHQANSNFQQAAPLIPITAAAMTMPALFRTINGQTYFPHKRGWFIGSVVFAAVSYVGWMWLLLGVLNVGIIGAPIAAVLAFAVSCVFLFVKGQRGPSPVDFPYRALGQAFLMGAVVAVFFKYVHFTNKWIQLAEVAALMILWITALFVTRVIPKEHRKPLFHILRTTFRRKPHGFDREEGLGVLGDRQRELLQDAIVNKIPLGVFSGELEDGNGRKNGGGDGLGPAAQVEPERLVKILRKAGKGGGIPVGQTTEHDAKIAKFLFADVPTAASNATMRSLVSAGANSNDLRALEDLVEYLEKSPSRVWSGDDARRRSA
jgi:O-antigen/teichoic acid export membrane protein